MIIEITNHEYSCFDGMVSWKRDIFSTDDKSGFFLQRQGNQPISCIIDDSPHIEVTGSQEVEYSLTFVDGKLELP